MWKDPSPNLPLYHKLCAEGRSDSDSSIQPHVLQGVLHWVLLSALEAAVGRTLVGDSLLLSMFAG